MSSVDKIKLDALDVTNLTVTTAASTLTVNSSTGTDAILPAATTSLAGVMTAADKTKLNALPSTVDGSETKVSAGTNVTVTGAGTIASPYVINSTATGGTTSNWFTTIDNITLFATANPTTWITEVNPQEYTIVVPVNQRLERIAYLSEVGVNRNSTTNQTIFNINTSATANTNTTLLNTFTPTLSMNTSTGNVVPVGIGGSPSVSVSTPSGGIRTITIQGNTNITEGQSRIQINDLTV